MTQYLSCKIPLKTSALQWFKTCGGTSFPCTSCIIPYLASTSLSCFRSYFAYDLHNFSVVLMIIFVFSLEKLDSPRLMNNWKKTDIWSLLRVLFPNTCFFYIYIYKCASFKSYLAYFRSCLFTSKFHQIGFLKNSSQRGKESPEYKNDIIE